MCTFAGFCFDYQQAAVIKPKKGSGVPGWLEMQFVICSETKLCDVDKIGNSLIFYASFTMSVENNAELLLELYQCTIV